MLVKDLNDCDEFIAGDKTILRELLHPDKHDVKLRYSLAHATLKRGEASTLHKLKTSEVYYILEGEGVMHIEEETKKVYAGCIIYIPPDKKQYIESTGNESLKFICIVDPAWRKEDEEAL